ncbi:MAG: hypothetical protein HQL43_16750 [Alphaproteobacteria bacterium]|nr:hypothetical protein [Alphaproteobacteria bacterium]
MLMALLLPILVGFVGLGIDAALWYLSRRNLQAAADAAALAGALELRRGEVLAAITTVASFEATRNGWSDSDGDIVVNVPPVLPSAYTGNSTAVQVYLSQTAQTYFAAAVFDTASLTINVQATARASTSGTACILALDTTVSKALEFSGNTNVNLPDCGIAANSNADDAIKLSGNASVTVASAQTMGDISDTNSHLTASSGTQTHAAEITDPYSDLTVPNIGSTCNQTEYKVNPSATTTINASGSTPYVFCKGLDIKGTLNLGPGTYVINKGTFSLNAGASLTGTGVTFILTSTSGSDYAKFDLNGSASVNLTAPSTGTYAGVLMYADRNGPYQDNHVNGNSSAIYNGALYFPSSNLDFNGNSATGSSACTQIIAKTVGMNGNVGISTTGCAAIGARDISLSGSVILSE